MSAATGRHLSSSDVNASRMSPNNLPFQKSPLLLITWTLIGLTHICMICMSFSILRSSISSVYQVTVTLVCAPESRAAKAELIKKLAFWALIHSTPLICYIGIVSFLFYTCPPVFPSFLFVGWRGWSHANFQFPFWKSVFSVFLSSSRLTIYDGSD
jgi:hypothetical protein